MRSNGHSLGPFSCQPTCTGAAGGGTNLLAEPANPHPDLPLLIIPKPFPSSLQPQDARLRVGPGGTQPPGAVPDGSASG